jgi:hypothetical protein
LRVLHQAQVLDALRAAVPWLALPPVVAVSRDPVMLVLRWVPATPFFQVRHLIGPAVRDRIAQDLATVLAGLHDPGVLRAVAAAAGAAGAGGLPHGDDGHPARPVRRPGPA